MLGGKNADDAVDAERGWTMRKSVGATEKAEVPMSDVSVVMKKKEEEEKERRAKLLSSSLFWYRNTHTLTLYISAFETKAIFLAGNGVLSN